MIDNMDNLETFYKEKVGDLLFHYKQSAIGSKIRSPQSEFKWFMNESDAKYKMNEYLMTKAVEKVMEEVGDISVFIKDLLSLSSFLTPLIVIPLSLSKDFIFIIKSIVSTL